MENEPYKNTIEKMIGTWKVQPKDGLVREIIVSIKSRDCKISIAHNDGKQINEEFGRKAHWFGNQLMFPVTDTGKQYFVQYADDQKLVFGENKNTALIGHIEWVYTFKRI